MVFVCCDDVMAVTRSSSVLSTSRVMCHVSGRSPTRLSVVSVTDDYDAVMNSSNILSSSPPNNRLNPLKNPSTPRIHLSDASNQSNDSRRSRDNLPRKAQVLNLGVWLLLTNTRDVSELLQTVVRDRSTLELSIL